MKKETGKIIMIVIGILILAAVIVFGIKFFRSDTNNNDVAEHDKGVLSQLLDCDSFQRLEINSDGTAFDEVNQAFKGVDEEGEVEGFVVFVSAKGYNGPVEVRVATDETGRCVEAVSIGESSEENGAAAGEAGFLDQFKDRYIPFSLDGMYTKEYEDINEALKDGIYHSETRGYDKDFTDFVEIEVKNGAIEKVTWDGFNAQGDKKSELSKNGDYASEGTKPWHEQAEKLQDMLVDIQDPSAILMDDQGNADGIALVDINIGAFVFLSEQCLQQARDAYAADPQETVIHAVSGATITSMAVVNAVNIGTSYIIDNFII